MSRKTNKKLSDFSLAELHAELERRKALGSPENANWYFIPQDDEEGSTGPSFLLVHKRFWHHSHHIDDGHLDHLRGNALTLPDGFDEVMESTFEFTKGDKNEAIRQLESYGFTQPAEGFERYAKIVHIFETKEKGKKSERKKYRIDVVCDTPKIEKWFKTIVEACQETQPIFTDLDSYEQWLRGLAESRGWLFLFRKGIYDILYGCIIEKEVEENLPPYPPDPFEPGQLALRDDLMELPDD